MSHFYRRRYAFLTGVWAERLTSLVLRMKGYVIVARRFKTPWGEVDVIARHADTVVFVEVKKRATFDQALEAIRPYQRARIQKAASHFLQRYQGRGQAFQVRFDVVCWQPWSWPLHLSNVWNLGVV